MKSPMTTQPPILTGRHVPQTGIRFSKGYGFVVKLLERLSVFILAGVAWYLASIYLPLGENPLVPAPSLVLTALIESLPELWTGTLSSFAILLPGFALAVVLGIAAGLAVGTARPLQQSFLPFARVAAPIPPTV